MPSREDFVYVGVTLTSALAIAVAGTQQLSDAGPRHTRTQPRYALTRRPPTAPPALAASPVANVALLQLVEKGPAVGRGYAPL